MNRESRAHGLGEVGMGGPRRGPGRGAPGLTEGRGRRPSAEQRPRGGEGPAPSAIFSSRSAPDPTPGPPPPAGPPSAPPTPLRRRACGGARERAVSRPQAPHACPQPRSHCPGGRPGIPCPPPRPPPRRPSWEQASGAPRARSRGRARPPGRLGRGGRAGAAGQGWGRGAEARIRPGPPGSPRGRLTHAALRPPSSLRLARSLARD